MIEYIDAGEVKEITFVDGDQVIEATLDDGVDREGGNQVMAYWLTDTQAEIEDAGPGAGRRRRDRGVHHRGRQARACSARSWRPSCPFVLIIVWSSCG